MTIFCSVLNIYIYKFVSVNIWFIHSSVLYYVLSCLGHRTVWYICNKVQQSLISNASDIIHITTDVTRSHPVHSFRWELAPWWHNLVSSKKEGLLSWGHFIFGPELVHIWYVCNPHVSDMARDYVAVWLIWILIWLFFIIDKLNQHMSEHMS